MNASARPPIDATQVLPVPTWSDPRVHLLDDTWLLTLFGVLVATAVPWLVSGFDLDFFPVAIGVLVLGAIHIAFTLLARPARSGEHPAAMTVLHSLGVVVVGFIWLHAGGLQNPAFLVVFLLPVIGAIFLSRWQPYLMAVLAILVAGAVALTQAPELRWYVPGFNTAGAWLAATLNRGAALSGPFPSFYAPSAYFIVMLEVFAIMTLACAVAAEYLGTIFERLYSHIGVARAAAERGQELWASLVEGLPLPALLVDADTGRILCVSTPAAAFCDAAPEVGRSLYETIQFSYPDVVQDLLAGTGGTAPLCMIRTGEKLHATSIHVRHVLQEGRRFVLLMIQDKTEELTVRAALDVAEQATLVIDARGGVLDFNTPTRALFADIEKGADASRLLPQSAAAGRWWEPGLTGRRKMHVEIAPRIYQVATTAVPLPGEEEGIYIVTFMPVARTALGERAANTQLVAAARGSLSNSSSVAP